MCVFFISTYTDGTPPSGGEWFYRWLEDTVSDFRVQKPMLRGLHYTVFGLGNSLYGDNFNVVCQILPTLQLFCLMSECLFCDISGQ